jgi:hypothetical protein
LCAYLSESKLPGDEEDRWSYLEPVGGKVRHQPTEKNDALDGGELRCKRRESLDMPRGAIVNGPRYHLEIKSESENVKMQYELK